MWKYLWYHCSTDKGSFKPELRLKTFKFTSTEGPQLDYGVWYSLEGDIYRHE
jgi:hypothetical protein